MDTLCRLMLPDLPLRIEPKRLARTGETIAGQYAIQDMQRLGGLLYDNSGTVIFRLEFNFDDNQNIPYIRGSIETQVNIPCQRCLGGMEFRINNPVFLGVVSNQAEYAILPDECDPLQLEAGSIALQGLIEDELILALPISSMHEADECKATELLNEINDKGRSSPFAALDKLNRK
jgi:uncharacterized protein